LFARMVSNGISNNSVDGIGSKVVTALASVNGAALARMVVMVLSKDSGNRQC